MSRGACRAGTRSSLSASIPAPQLDNRSPLRAPMRSLPLLALGRAVCDLVNRRMAGGFPAPGVPFSTFSLRYCVFGSLYRAGPDDLPSRLRFKYCRLLRERINAFSCLCGRLLDNDEFGKPRHKKGPGFLEFFVAYFRKRLDDAFNVLACHIVWMPLSD